MASPFLFHKQAAGFLGVGEKFLYREGEAGRVRRVRVAGAWRYRESWLENYIDRLSEEQTDMPLRDAGSFRSAS